MISEFVRTWSTSFVPVGIFCCRASGFCAGSVVFAFHADHCSQAETTMRSTRPYCSVFALRMKREPYQRAVADARGANSAMCICHFCRKCMLPNLLTLKGNKFLYTGLKVDYFQHLIAVRCRFHCLSFLNTVPSIASVRLLLRSMGLMQQLKF